MLITALLFAVAACISVLFVMYLLGFGRKNLNARKILEDSVTDWRNDELDLDAFDVKTQETSISEVFSTFKEAEGDGYVSFDQLNERVLGIAESETVQSIISGSEKALDKGRKVFSSVSSSDAPSK
ncbi:hypothetical protein JOD55_001505 [Arcanobacterium pluranimalium]|uniref:hypothetical protein n=1 Tax=Arcanobacterium pluranimalium TaxID=108028 RepID=UPI001956DD6A|nr:hypothetical protein [Arcanobacterium pluranimalium]MBM7825678.1 hypothetical protein [Arcanobacterium pluranimalium]